MKHLPRFREGYNIKSGHKLGVRKNTVGRIILISYLGNLSAHLIPEVGDELSGNKESTVKTQ